jgi:N-acetylglucosaminyldiphosphoundecaprenol N-acetyl-beta-D-mannosaminyltransferase
MISTPAPHRPSAPAPRRPPLVLGPVRIDAVDFSEALAAIEALVDARQGGAVFTPNVDHVMIAHEDARMRDAYARADLSVPDGMPLVWASHLLRSPLPERVAGSDLVPALIERAAQRRWRVYFLGGAPGAAQRASEVLMQRLPTLHIVGIDAPRFDPDAAADSQAEVIAKVRAARPDLVFVAFGAPKQEIWIHRWRDELRPAVMLGVGASLDFLAGKVPRAPRWMARSGLEWLYRLSREPGRMWRRYLVRDPKFVFVVARALRDHSKRAGRHVAGS